MGVFPFFLHNSQNVVKYTNDNLTFCANTQKCILLLKVLIRGATIKEQYTNEDFQGYTIYDFIIAWQFTNVYCQKCTRMEEVF